MPTRLDPKTYIPTDIRRRVSADGTATWTRPVPGGRLLLTTLRSGTRLTTEITGVQEAAHDGYREALFGMCPGGEALLPAARRGPC